MGLNGTLLEDKMRNSRVEVNILASTSVPFRPTTVQVPIFALTNMKRIRVYTVSMLSAHGLYDTGRLFFVFLLSHSCKQIRVYNLQMCLVAIQ